MFTLEAQKVDMNEVTVNGISIGAVTDDDARKLYDIVKGMISQYGKSTTTAPKSVAPKTTVSAPKATKPVRSTGKAVDYTPRTDLTVTVVAVDGGVKLDRYIGGTGFAVANAKLAAMGLNYNRNVHYWTGSKTAIKKAVGQKLVLTAVERQEVMAQREAKKNR